jgi:excisionase family DNA binding protein
VDSELLSVDESAGLLHIRVSTVRAWILTRRIPFVKLGRRVFLRRQDLNALIERSVVPASAEKR